MLSLNLEKVARADADADVDVDVDPLGEDERRSIVELVDGGDGEGGLVFFLFSFFYSTSPTVHEVGRGKGLGTRD